MAYRCWNEPPEDFTVYLDITDLERLNSFERHEAKEDTSATPDSVATVADQHVSEARAIGTAAAKAVEGAAKAVEGAAKAVQAVAAHATKSTEPVKTFDQTVYFAWRMTLLPDHVFTHDSDGGGEGEDRVVFYRARSLICSCYNGNVCSATLRVDNEWEPQCAIRRAANGQECTQARLEPEGAKGNVRYCKLTRLENNIDVRPVLQVLGPSVIAQAPWGFNPPPTVPGATSSSPIPQKKNIYLFSATQLSQVVFPAIFRPESESELDKKDPVITHGLVVISGQTGTLKSTILRKLLEQYLGHFNYRGWGKDRRYPHVLTVEDPIEKPIVPLDARKKEEYLEHPTKWDIDFTPRQIRKDVESLGDALYEALRQTPTAVIVGETREEGEWEEILRFASTGHLCFTTTHAGSLVETMRTIIEATESTTPDLRSSLVEKIIAVVHLRTFDLVVPTPGGNGIVTTELGDLESMLLPAIWRNVSGGANFFVSDGLSAILPRRAEGRALERPPASCRGRSDFARSLLGQLKQETRTKLQDHVIRIATKADLEGV
jgi:hypothetical protein